MSGRKPASVLTQSQLDYLAGEGEPSNPREYDRRIRKRIGYGLLDLNLLFEYLDVDELRKIFGPHHGGAIDPGQELIHGLPDSGGVAAGSVPGAIAFLAWGLDVDDEPIYPPFDEPQPAFDRFTDALESGINQFLAHKKGLYADVSVSVELKNVNRADDLIED